MTASGKTCYLRSVLRHYLYNAFAATCPFALLYAVNLKVFNGVLGYV